MLEEVMELVEVLGPATLDFCCLLFKWRVEEVRRGEGYLFFPGAAMGQS